MTNRFDLDDFAESTSYRIERLLKPLGSYYMTRACNVFCGTGLVNTLWLPISSLGLPLCCLQPGQVRAERLHI